MSNCYEEGINQSCKICVIAAILFIESFLLNVVLPIFPQLMWNIKRRTMFGSNCTTNCDGSDGNSLFGTVGIYSSLVFLSGYLVQLLLLPIVRQISRRNSITSIAMFIGSILVAIGFNALILFQRDVMYKFFVSRVVQCTGASFVIGCGLIRLTCTLQSDEKRQVAFSVATLGMTVGVIVGPVFGGLLYYVNNTWLFQILICSPIVVELFLQCMIFECNGGLQTSLSKTRLSLLLHREVFIGLVTNCITTACVVVVNILVPLWLLHVINIRSWMMGLLFLPGAISNTLGSLFSTCVFGMNGHCTMIIVALIAILISMGTLPFIYTFKFILIPMTFIGLGQGFSSSLIIQMLAKFLTNVEREPESTFFLFIEIAEKLGSVIGPGLSALLLVYIDFETIMIIFAILLGLLIPLQLFMSECFQKRHEETEKLISNEDSNSQISRD